MTTIVCQHCGNIIAHQESVQVKTLYGVCTMQCNSEKQKNK
ncbi:GapA-binding peptide SR1P [Brevibacillus daliensis]|nr:GapA-binding peptide SR1P [Brevibacillus daliensis]